MQSQLQVFRGFTPSALQYFWTLFILITGQVIVTVLTFFRRDEVFSFVTENATKLGQTTPEEITSLVQSIENNLAFLGVCLGVLVLVQTYALVLAATHFKRSCLLGLNSISKASDLPSQHTLHQAPTHRPLVMAWCLWGLECILERLPQRPSLVRFLRLRLL